MLSDLARPAGEEEDGVVDDEFVGSSPVTAIAKILTTCPEFSRMGAQAPGVVWEVTFNSCHIR
jgi:hypothetical protein